MTEDDLRAAAERFRTAPQRALDERDAVLQQAHAEGWRQKDLVAVTGFTRETIRRALDPAVREAVRAQRRTAE